MTADSTYSNWSSNDNTSERSPRQDNTVSRHVNFADYEQAKQASLQGSTASSVLPDLQVSAGDGQISGTPAAVQGATPAQLAGSDSQSLAALYRKINTTAVDDIYNAAKSDSANQFASFLPDFMREAAPALERANATSNLLAGIGQFAQPGDASQTISPPQYSFNFAPNQEANPTARQDASQLGRLSRQFQRQAMGDIQTGAQEFTSSQFKNFLQDLSNDYVTDLNSASSVSVPPELPAPVVPTPTPEQPAPVVPTPTPEQPAPVVPTPTPEQPAPVVPTPTPEQPAPVVPTPVAPTPTPEQPAPVTPPASPTTGAPGQGLYINGRLTGMQPEVNLSGATDLGTLGNLAGVNTSTGWNSSDTGGVVGAVASKDNGTFSVTVKNPWNENGQSGTFTEQIPIPDEGLAALEAQASKTNSDGHVIIEDTATNTYYDFWEAQNIAPNGQSGGTAETLVQGAINGNATPGSTAAGISMALSDTSAPSGTHMLSFIAPTNWMSPGNPGLVAGSTNSDVTSAGGALQEGDILQLPQSVANAWIAANPNATAAQLQIIKDMEPTSVGGGGGMIVDDQAGTGWSGDESPGIWQMNGGVDLTFMNNSNGPNILSNLEVYK